MNLQKRSFLLNNIIYIILYPYKSYQFIYLPQNKTQSITFSRIFALNSSDIDYSSFCLGLPLKQILLHFKKNLWTILKLIILEGRCLFYSKNSSTLTSCLLAICSLIPGVIAFGGSNLSSEKLCSHLSREEMYGFPLHVFHKKVLFMPLFTLNDLILLKDVSGFLIGTTNLVLLELPQIAPDAIFDIDSDSIKIINKELLQALQPTNYEISIIGKLLKTVKPKKGKTLKDVSWSCCGSTGEEGLETYETGNDYIRRKFSKYFHSFAVNYAVAKFVHQGLESVDGKIKGKDKSGQLTKLRALYKKIKNLEHHSEIMAPPINSIPSKQKKEEDQKDAEASPKVEIIRDSLSPSKSGPYLKQEAKMKQLKKKQFSEKEKIIYSLLKNYNINWLIQWQSTINYKIWLELHCSTLYCLSEFIDIVTHSTIHYESGEVYIGEICGGKRNGTGTMLFSDGVSLYEGDWVEDSRDGNGSLVLKDGTKYSGQFSNNQYHGTGELREASGDTYVGDFCNGMKEGMAHIKFSSGDMYIGEMKHNRMHGKGQYVFASGEVYIGEFEESMRHGQGQIIHLDGTVEEGEWYHNAYKSNQ